MSAPYASTLSGGCSLLIGALLHTASTIVSSKGFPDTSVFECLDILITGLRFDRTLNGSGIATATAYSSISSTTAMPTIRNFEPWNGHSVQSRAALCCTLSVELVTVSLVRLLSKRAHTSEE